MARSAVTLRTCCCKRWLRASSKITREEREDQFAMDSMCNDEFLWRTCESCQYYLFLRRRITSAAPKPARPIPSSARLTGSGVEVGWLANAPAGINNPLATNKSFSKNFIMTSLKGLVLLAAHSVPKQDSSKKQGFQEHDRKEVSSDLTVVDYVEVS